MEPRPSVSVVVASDYGGRTADDWSYLRKTLRGLAAQDFDEPFEVLLVDATPEDEVMPADVAAALPGLRVLHGTRDRSRVLLNDAVAQARADVVALLDGDCAPVPRWLRAGVAALRSRDDAVAVSGLTVYPGPGFRDRVLGALSRGFIDPGGPGPTRFISNNNALVRRAALLRHPLSSAYPRALAARMQTEAVRLEGGGLYFEPAMRVEHRFEGWPMERRLRHNVGYRAIRTRQLDPRLPHAWMVRLGALTIPTVLAARIVDSFRDCVRAGRHFGLRRLELPAAFAAAVYVHLLEVRGMGKALAEARMAEPPP
ncbi:MAG: glycosyltransferase [Thermodesulfobacteriota bacterium]